MWDLANIHKISPGTLLDLNLPLNGATAPLIYGSCAGLSARIGYGFPEVKDGEYCVGFEGTQDVLQFPNIAEKMFGVKVDPCQVLDVLQIDLNKLAVKTVVLRMSGMEFKEAVMQVTLPDIDVAVGSFGTRICRHISVHRYKFAQAWLFISGLGLENLLLTVTTDGIFRASGSATLTAKEASITLPFDITIGAHAYCAHTV